MGKPSITNIRPPSSTTVWTPPKTAWDLNSATDQLDPNYAANGSVDTGTTDGAFDSKTDQIGYVAMGLTESDVDHYQYVFLGVNGGENETVIANYALRGIIATGNGMDSILGGSTEDLLFAGNGKDTVSGGGGDDIVFGENGVDTLYGDHGQNLAHVADNLMGDDQISGGNADDVVYGDQGDHLTGGTDLSDATHGNDVLYGDDGNDLIYGEDGNDTVFGGVGNDTIVGGTDRGTFSVTVGQGEAILAVTAYAGPVGEFNNGNADGTPVNDNSNHLLHVGYTLDASNDVLAWFRFSPEDLPVLNVDDAHTFTAVVFTSEAGGHTNVITTTTFTLNHESESYVFSIDVTDNLAGGSPKVFVYEGTPTNAELDDPHNDALGGSQPFPGTLDGLVTFTVGEETGNFAPGDSLTGGAGDDTFVWGKGDGTDLITDFDQGNIAAFDPVNEHDTLTLHLDTGWTVHTTTDGATGDVIVYFKDAANAVVANSAIELAGITDDSHLSIVNTIANDWQVTGV
jgi:Ca2+-binding RTX toxin-like protein